VPARDENVRLDLLQREQEHRRGTFFGNLTLVEIGAVDEEPPTDIVLATKREFPLK
jgi:hypothetical protein